MSRWIAGSTRAINAASRTAFRRVPNPSLQWHGISATSGAGLQERFLLRIGDCSWQEIPHGHTWGRPGYPRLVAEALMPGGIAMRFANHHVGLAADLPDPVRLERTCGGAKPDAILVELGTYYAGRGLVRGGTIEPYELRTWFNWVAGPLGGTLHRLISRPLLRHFGHFRAQSASHLGADRDLEAFLLRLREHYGRVPIAYLPPHMADIDAAVSPARLEDAATVLIAAARAASADVIDVRRELAELASLGTGSRHARIFGANGHDLRLAGHEIVAGAMLEWLRRAWAAKRVGNASAASDPGIPESLPCSHRHGGPPQGIGYAAARAPGAS